MAAIGPIYVVSNRTSKKRADLAKALRSTGWKQVKAPPEVDHPDLVSVWRNEEADAFVAWIDDQDVAGHYYGIVFGGGWAAGLKALVGTRLIATRRSSAR